MGSLNQYFLNNNEVNMTQRHILSIHKCTDEDYDAFYPINENDKSNFNVLKQKKSMWCIDKG